MGLMVAALVPGTEITSKGYLSRAAESFRLRIDALRREVRTLYHQAVLFCKHCPDCGAATLEMEQDGQCRCRACSLVFDPTLAFQKCASCNTSLERRRMHYWCPQCAKRIASLYCFDATVFDAVYFREMMRVSRERKTQKARSIRNMLAHSRSCPLQDMGDPNLASVDGLLPALDGFVDLPMPKELLACFLRRSEFDLDRYRQHIRERVTGCIVRFEGIAAVIEDRRLDRIFRFIAVIFMEHEREIVTGYKDGQLVIEEYETDTER